MAIMFAITFIVGILFSTFLQHAEKKLNDQSPLFPIKSRVCFADDLTKVGGIFRIERRGNLYLYLIKSNSSDETWEAFEDELIDASIIETASFSDL